MQQLCQQRPNHTITAQRITKTQQQPKRRHRLPGKCTWQHNVLLGAGAQHHCCAAAAVRRLDGIRRSRLIADTVMGGNNVAERRRCRLRGRGPNSSRLRRRRRR